MYWVVFNYRLNLIFRSRKIDKCVYVCVCMATKTISITCEAYLKLARLKKENESFSMVINRVTGKRKLSDFAGILSKESADSLEEGIKESRKFSRERHLSRIKDINEMLE